MTRLEDRLTAIERRLDEIQAMLAHLIALVESRGLPAVPPETASEAMEEVEQELLQQTWAEPDPLDVQYELVRHWAAQGRRDDLSGFDLSGRSLREIDLKDARLSRANLSRADLTGARLGRADLGEADLNRAQMSKSNLARANLKDALVTHQQLAAASTLDGATMPDGRPFDGDYEPYKAAAT